MAKWSREELTCPECGFVATNPNGLRGHRQFKHGVRPGSAQLPLQQQDHLITESALEQRIGELEQQLGVSDEQLLNLEPSSVLDRLEIVEGQQNSLFEEQLKHTEDIATLQEQLDETNSHAKAAASAAEAAEEQARAIYQLLSELHSQLKQIHSGLVTAFDSLEAHTHNAKGKFEIKDRLGYELSKPRLEYFKDTAYSN
jgi:chromosome segregation ATPase